MATTKITAARECELWLWFVALLVCPGCLTHLIVLRFADAFLEHLRALAPSFGIFIFTERFRCLASVEPGKGSQASESGNDSILLLWIDVVFSGQLAFGLLIVSFGRFGRITTIDER